MAKAIFDLDGTLIKGQSQQYLIFFLYRKGLIGAFNLAILLGWFLGYRIGFFKDPNIIFSLAFKIIKNKTEGEVKEMITEFYSSTLEKKLNFNIVRRLNEHRKKGDDIFLVTNAIKPIAAEVAKNLGIQKIIATELEAKNGRYTGKIKGKIIYGENKAEVLRNNFNKFQLEESYIYADHFSDLPLLKITGHPVLVSEDKKNIAKIQNCLGKRLEIITRL